MMKALRTVIVFQVDQFNTLGGNNTYERAVDSGSGGHTWGNTALPYFRYRSSSSHSLLVQGASMSEKPFVLWFYVDLVTG